MKLDLGIGQSIRYRGQEGQVIEDSPQEEEALIYLPSGESLWVSYESLLESNPDLVEY
jgi:hypothetical protein